jgi:hypothetical protein
MNNPLATGLLVTLLCLVCTLQTNDIAAFWLTLKLRLRPLSGLWTVLRHRPTRKSDSTTTRT